MEFDTKIVIVVREDLATWQKLNVTAFLASGIVGASPGIIGAPYEDAAGNGYLALAGQPMIVLAAGAPAMAAIHRRALDRGVRLALYIEAMFATGHDAANREAMRAQDMAAMGIVGLALREERRLADRITKGARLHP